MADIRRVPLLLVILFAAAIGGYFVIKSQIQKDFVIAEMPNVMLEPVLEFRASSIFNATTGEYIGYGEYPFAVFPYYYNNTPYALGIIVSYNETDKVYIKLYHLPTKSVVSEKVIEKQYMRVISGPSTFYYTDKSGRMIATVYVGSTDGSTFLNWTVYKIVVEGGNITEFKEIYSLNNPTYPPQLDLHQAIVFEGLDRDYILLMIKDRTQNTRIFMALDEYKNLLYYVSTYGEFLGRAVYETNKTIVFAVGFTEGANIKTIHYFVFDKDTKTFTRIEVIPGEISFGAQNFIAGYNEDLVIFRTNPMIGIIRGERFETYAFLDVYRGWVKGNKVFGITWQNNYPEYYLVNYQLFNYSFDEGFNAQKIAEGLFMNLISPFFEGTGAPGDFWIDWLDRYVEVLGLKGNYLSILKAVNERNIKRGYYVTLVDLDNYKVYNIKVGEARWVTESITQEGLIYYIWYNVPYIMENAIYHPRFLIPFVNTTAVFVRNATTMEYLYGASNITVVVYALTTYPIVQNITNETQIQPQPQPKPQTGFGVEITPTPTEINITQPSVTQNVTVTRPTYPGIQSVIEMVRRNWWIILVAILLLILVGSSLRKRAS